VRLDEAADPEALWPALELATRDAPLHPDYVEELLRLAARSARRGKPEEQLRWLERAVALHPQSTQAREALAKVRAPEAMEPAAVPASTALPRAPDGSPVPDNAGLTPARTSEQQE
jgi:hypothetical protein